MSDLVLVRYDVGEEYVITSRGRAFAKANGLEVLDEPAVGRDGSVARTRRIRKSSGRPAKPKISVAEAAEKKAAQTADDNPPSKEN